jgi:hypothetical protein
MLKPPGEQPSADGDRSFGELATQLLDDAKTYARAEIDLAKAIAADKSKSLRIAAILLLVAACVAIGALNALCVAIFVLLATLIGPLLGGIAAFVLIGIVAGIFGWFGWKKLRESL